MSAASALYLRLTRGFGLWLTPKRLRIYPATIVGFTVVAQLLNFATRPAIDGTPWQYIVGGDFLAVYTAGRFVLDGRLSELYDMNAQKAFHDRLLGGTRADFATPFVHPPFDALLYAPFAIGSYWGGLLAWWGVGFAALTLAAYLFHRDCVPAAGPTTGRLLLYCFLFYPTLAWFVYGQHTSLVLLIYTGTFVLLRRKQDFWAGAVLGCLVYKPQLALALGLVLVVQRRWRALVGGLVSVSLWVALGFALSPTAMVSFVRLVGTASQFHRLNGWGESSLAYFAYLLLDGVSKPAANMLGALLTLAGLLLVGRWWWRRPWQPRTREWDLMMAATLGLGLLVSPHLFFYDLMLLLLPLGIVLSHYPHGTAGRALDGGELLAWSGWLYIVTFAGSYLAGLQLRLTEAAGLPPMAIQISAPVIMVWAMVIYRLSLGKPVVQPAPIVVRVPG